MRLNAYYYSFGGTGEECVDRVLSAVACAGKAYHHTEHWSDECSAWDGLRGDSPVDWIANAAEDAAAELARLRKELELAQAALARVDRLADRLHELARDHFEQGLGESGLHHENVRGWELNAAGNSIKLAIDPEAKFAKAPL
jgi:hypothetical protein